MLTPDDWKKIEKQANNLYNNLEFEIIQEIAERIANVGYMNTVALNNTLIAQEMGILYEDVIELVAKYNNTSVSQIKEIFETAGVKSLEFDDKIYKEAGLNPVPIKRSRSIMQLMSATIEKTNYNLSNLMMTTANTTQTEFYNAINKSYMEVATGVKSYSQSIVDTIKDISNKGAYIEYPSGQHRSIENAVRMNIVTSVNQTCGKLQLMRADDMGWDLMELTAHGGARPEHAEWQGKIVSRSGQKGYLTLKDIGYGTATGFKGVNCRHDWMPYYEGSTRTYNQEQLNELKNEKILYNGEKISKYEATQIQRKIERQIRQDKKDIAGLEGILTSNAKDDKLIEDAKTNLTNSKNKLKIHNSTLNDFIEQTKFRKDYSRLAIGKIKTENILKKNSNNSIIIRDKKQSKNRYEIKEETINRLFNNELKNIKMPIKPTYNSKIRDNGKTIANTYPWGEVKELKGIYIGKQDKNTKEFLIDTLLHEKLEAKILITKTEKYKKLNNISDDKRHEYINKIIKRYFKMKGWNYEHR